MQCAVRPNRAYNPTELTISSLGCSHGVCVCEGKGIRHMRVRGEGDLLTPGSSWKEGSLPGPHCRNCCLSELLVRVLQ